MIGPPPDVEEWDSHQDKQTDPDRTEDPVGGREDRFFQSGIPGRYGRGGKKWTQKTGDLTENNADHQFKQIAYLHFIDPFFLKRGIKKGVLFLYSRYSEPNRSSNSFSSIHLMYIKIPTG